MFAHFTRKPILILLGFYNPTPEHCSPDRNADRYANGRAGRAHSDADIHTRSYGDP